ncbi:MAG TPA: hypothetical protein VFF49_06590 [Thermodesulfobacteriota bacterium]|nr:hypothetical protein [Thermodesulfobacteriota bacterium]
MLKYRPSYKPVRRISDGRIFFCALSAAKFYRKEIAHQIENCCSGFLAVVEGENWEWYDGEIAIPDLGDIEELRFRIARKKSKLEREHRAIITSRSNRSKIYVLNMRQTVFEISNFLRKFCEIFDPVKWYRYNDLFNQYKLWCKRYSYEQRFTIARSFGRHLSSWEDLYNQSCGVKIRKTKGKYFNYKEVTFVEANINHGFNPFLPLNEILHENSSNIVIHRIPVRNSQIPVFCLSDQHTYPSILETSNHTGCNPLEIRFALHGDMDQVLGFGQPFKFIFGKFENVPEDWFLNIIEVENHKHESINMPISIIELISGVPYLSIREASRQTGISAYKINKSLRDPKEKAARVIRFLGQEPIRYKFVKQ